MMREDDHRDANFNDQDSIRDEQVELQIEILETCFVMTPDTEMDVNWAAEDSLIEKKAERATKTYESDTKSSYTNRLSRSGNEVTYNDEESLIQKKAKKRAERSAEIEESDTESSKTYRRARSRRTTIFDMILGKVSRSCINQDLLPKLMINEQLIKYLLFQKLLKEALNTMSKRTEQKVKIILGTGLVKEPEDLLAYLTGSRF